MAIFNLHSIKIAHNKNTAGCFPKRMPVPESVVIPVSMHIGAPAVPVVKAGDTVKTGQLIASSGGYVSSPVYASISGKVKKIDDILLAGGNTVPAIVIESDGSNDIYSEIKAPVINSFEDFIKAVADSGVVGMGGAGFPTHVKLNVKDLSKIEFVIINCAECEAYITSDTRTMLDMTDEFFDGLSIIKQHIGDKRFIIGIEDNKKECIEKLKPYCASSGVELKVLPSTYPTGGEKVLVYKTTGRVIPEGKLPLDAGAVVLNCTTVVALQKYIRTGMPIVEKTVTVAGSAVKEPQNVIVPIGTRVKDLIEFCGGYKEEPKKILYGGPMMGISMPDDSCPVLKNTNAILAFNAKDATPPKQTECINCGRCVSHCPMNLMPAYIATAYAAKDAKRLEQLKVNICMECGCCSYVCPAKRPLVQTNKLSKALLKNYQMGAAKK